ncbi:MAG TPA: hypothetical protein VK147_11670 [Candidatus Didemnitutus sp.]|nr:hypothetical protein [Candidatus Didemnitutus sp.]
MSQSANSRLSGHRLDSFVAFAYYRELDYGGYDGIVAATASNIYTSGR